MYKIYFKQAWQMLKQNRFISIIAILGTALAVTMIMTIIVAGTIKNLSLAPEINRDRTLYISEQFQKDSTSGSSNGRGMSHTLQKMLLDDLKTPELISVVSSSAPYFRKIVNQQGSTERINSTVRMTDDSYWKIMSFSFVTGRPFSREEFQSGVKVAVISQSMAQKLFRQDDPIGKIIEINFLPFYVVGVVKDVSAVFEEATGDVWIPATVNDESANAQSVVMLLARNKRDFQAIKDEVREAERKFDIANTPWKLYLRGPQEHSIYAMKYKPTSVDEENQMVRSGTRKNILIFVLLLIIPAVNLAGFSLSQMKKRRSEIGIRKAFGAKRRVLLFQILCENMLTSLIGGIIGLLLSFAVIFWLRSWLLGIPSDGAIPVGALISLPVILAVSAVCILLNLLSAGIPAYRASKINIVDSIMPKE